MRSDSDFDWLAATHTPFDDEGELALDLIEGQAAHLLAQGLSGAFVCGTTGEGLSMSVAERLQVAERWADVVRGTGLSLFVHVGANALPEAQALAAGAAAIGADAIALMPPVFFRPESEEALVDWCVAVAGAADGLPLSYYESPGMSGVELSMPRFIELARDAGIHYRGLKFTDSNIELFRELCGGLREGEGMWWGRDEELRSGLAAGATGAIGSSYNFAAGVYRPVLEESPGSGSALAAQAQADAVRLIELLAGYGYLPAAKAVMDMLGVPVGPARAPLTRIGSEGISSLRRDLEQLGFFDWIRAS